VSYTNPKTGQTLKAEQIDATASVGSLQGPFSMSGNATVNGVPLSLDFNLSEPKTDGHDTAFHLKVLSGTLDFTGKVSELGPNADVKGHLAVSTGVRPTSSPPWCAPAARRRPVRRFGRRTLHLRQRHRSLADAARLHRLQDVAGRRHGIGAGWSKARSRRCRATCRSPRSTLRSGLRCWPSPAHSSRLRRRRKPRPPNPVRRPSQRPRRRLPPRSRRSRRR
jgi:hypothetical protein